MAKLYFHYSTMNAGKSTLLLQASHNYREGGMATYLITAQFDNRAGEGRIASRIGIDAGIKDYLSILNGQGGIKGRKVRYVAEDTAYKVDQSMAVFKKITSQEKVHLYYADSTGFVKTVNPEVERMGSMIMTGASFAKEITNAQKYPLQFMVGPDYSEMVGILLQYIAKTKPGAKVALVYSDTEFGRDPVEAARVDTKRLGLNLVLEIVTPPGSVDVSTEVIKLRRAAPDFTIFHGYVSAPIPEFINQSRAQGIQSQFMGTFWSMDNSTVMRMGPNADGFMGVMPYRYYYDTEGKAPMLERIRKMRPEYQSTAYAGDCYFKDWPTTLDRLEQFGCSCALHLLFGFAYKSRQYLMNFGNSCCCK